MSQTSETTPPATTSIPIANSNTATASANPTSSAPTSPGSEGASVEYYFYVVAALAVVGFGLLVFFWRLRRRQRKVLLQQRRQSALAQDLEGSHGDVLRRRWLYGNRREAPWTRREEGLNERGEAPPPYMGGSVNRDETERWDAPPPDVAPAFPLQAMTKPPEYHETFRAVPVDQTETQPSGSDVAPTAPQNVRT